MRIAVSELAKAEVKARVQHVEFILEKHGEKLGAGTGLDTPYDISKCLSHFKVSIVFRDLSLIFDTTVSSVAETVVFGSKTVAVVAKAVAAEAENQTVVGEDADVENRNGDVVAETVVVAAETVVVAAETVAVAAETVAVAAAVVAEPPEAIAVYLPVPKEDGSLIEIWIDQRFRKVLREQGATGRAMVRCVILHELAHLIGKDPRFYAVMNESTDVGSEESNKLVEELLAYANDPNIQEVIETRCELLTCAMALGPQSLMKEKFFEAPFNFRKISEFFCFPLDCCIRWYALKLFPFPWHYMKYDVTKEKLIDSHVSTDQQCYGGFSWCHNPVALFANPDTVAGKCLFVKTDCNGITKCGVQSYYCFAHYVTGIEDIGTRDKIIVLGLPFEHYDILFRMSGRKVD